MHSTVIHSGIVALVGSPNCGKTTLFNWLTGLKYNTVNYPGSTVDYSIGSTHERYGPSVRLMDTPGIYSLFPKSPDEEVTINALFHHPQFSSAERVISVVDATQLSRHLLVTRQLIESGFQVILAITMVDLLREKGIELDVDLLSNRLKCPVILIDGRLGGGVIDLVDQVRSSLGETPTISGAIHRIANWNEDKIEKVLGETQLIEREVCQHKHSQQKLDSMSRTAQIDRLLLHPLFGLVFFVAIMAGIFTSIYWLAQPLMDAVDQGFSFVARSLMQLGPHSLWVDFLANGLVASFGSVLVFVPQIFILFFGIALLEDSGYLARSATLVDRPLRFLGLSGRSFVPLLSGYACAVPAMMAARTVSSRRERWLTLFIIPLMSCSARLPVYALLLTFIFFHQAAWKAGLTLAFIYVGSTLVGGVAALIASRVIRLQGKSLFCLELPVYRRPMLRSLVRQAYNRTLSYVRRAGPMIFLLSIIIWAGTTFPHYQLENETERLSQSYFGKIGQTIEPVFVPMGVDWRVGVGLMSAFAAREVFVSSLAVVFSVAGDDDQSMQASLLDKMSEAKMADGYPVFTLSSVVGLIVFFMIALQCLSTTSVAMRESGGWKFAIMQLVTFNLVAYVLAISVVQGLRAIGFS